uniref:Uncharacterized protein n=1 Tax=Timema poppense TaxID=170557 RepID=A0A7R9D3J6_TIMPO|nr:unnamed protein product [Timema poppensis]
MAQELLKFRQRAEAALATHCPDPQSHNGDRRRKRVWLSSPLMEKVQETVRPQACFMVMSRVDESENIRGVGPFVLERVISGAAESGVSIRKLCDGTIMIQTDNDIQMTKIMAMTEPLKPSKGEGGAAQESSSGAFPWAFLGDPSLQALLGELPLPPPGNSPSPGTKYVRLLLVRPLWSPVINVCGKTSEAAKVSPVGVLRKTQRVTANINTLKCVEGCNKVFAQSLNALVSSGETKASLETGGPVETWQGKRT